MNCTKKIANTIFALSLIAILLSTLIVAGCDESANIDAAGNNAMPTSKQARQVISNVEQLKASSLQAQETGKRFMTGMIIALVVIGIALPCVFWLLQRQMLLSQEKRIADKISEREASIKDELMQMEQKVLDVTREQRQQLIAELEELREKSVELDRTTREMFTEALHNFKNTRFLRRPGFFSKLFGRGKNRENIPENTTVIQINRPEDKSE